MTWYGFLMVYMPLIIFVVSAGVYGLCKLCQRTNDVMQSCREYKKKSEQNAAKSQDNNNTDIESGHKIKSNIKESTVDAFNSDSVSESESSSKSNSS